MKMSVKASIVLFLTVFIASAPAVQAGPVSPVPDKPDAGILNADAKAETDDMADMLNYIANPKSDIINSRELKDAETLSRLKKSDELASEIIDYARQYLGRPYRYGATGPKTFDCSGFTSHIFRNAGVELPRTSRSQFTQGQSVPKDQIKPGDLLFFSGRKGGKNVGHVGMAVEVDPKDGTIRFIHASSSRGIAHDSLSTPYFSRRYLGARRVLTE